MISAAMTDNRSSANFQFRKKTYSEDPKRIPGTLSSPSITSYRLSVIGVPPVKQSGEMQSVSQVVLLPWQNIIPSMTEVIGMT